MGFAGRSWVACARGVAAALAAAALAACATVEPPTASSGGGTMAPYYVHGRWYRPAEQPHYDEKGLASWYGPESGGRRTADGEPFEPDRPSAAHTTLPIPCIVEVTNLENGRRLRLRVNDRGPFAGDRILDVSREAAKELGFYTQGTARVRVRYVGPAPSSAGTVRTAMARVEPSASAAPQRGAVVVQAGAFVDLQNAERAQSALAGEGSASIWPIDVAGTRYYRVVVACPSGEDAGALRSRVAAAGFPSAKILGGS
jgi:rare lipoprotein A